MKTRNIMIVIGLLFCTNLLPAQENATEGSSDPCALNLSLFYEAAKNKQYAEAIAPWKAVYAECPQSNLAIYQQGRDILSWELDQLAKANNTAAYKETFDLLMDMYDKRIQYFGNDPRYPTAWILGVKGIDYIKYAKDDKLKKDAYKWLEESINGLGKKAELTVLSNFVVLSANIYKAEPEHASKFVEDYLKSTALIEQKILANPTSKSSASAAKIKESLDMIFVQSGAAECSTLDSMYADEVKNNLQNLDYLKKVISFYRSVGCNESDIYFTAAEAAHKMEPTAASANANAEMAYLKKDYNTAIQYYDEATSLETDNLQKAEYQYKISQIYYSDLSNFVRARQYALKSLELNPNNGKAYLLIGLMYANSKGIYDDPVKSKTVYWVAVDKFNRAKQADPSLSEDANRLIRTYSAYFPTKEEIFFDKDLNEGKSFTVGGWIGETTTVRIAN